MQKNRKCGTPIYEFVNDYKESNMCRLHMPGHKGNGPLGVEALDITEIKGADSLYEAEGIIAQSEQIASELFGSGATFYSTEGSSQCIRTMLYLAMLYAKEHLQKGSCVSPRPVIAAARNVHKAFIYAAALLDFDVIWLWPEEDMKSVCSCPITSGTVNSTLKSLEENGRKAFAVYVTSPDYLGNIADIKSLADVCHAHHALFLVDNAHGAYLHFLEQPIHPLDLGADMCCDSAHKTLPVLTGGAYLHISKRIKEELFMQVKPAMCMFGSTSPSYLTLCSLDLCNAYLADDFRLRLKACTKDLKRVRHTLMQFGWRIEDSDPLRITIAVPKYMTGSELAETLRTNGIECEYADEEFVVFMFTPENTAHERNALVSILSRKDIFKEVRMYKKVPNLALPKTRQMMSIREAMFCLSQSVTVEEAKGRICRTPTVSCPPAIPIAVPGELIEENAIKLFKYYGIDKIDVVRRST